MTHVLIINDTGHLAYIPAHRPCMNFAIKHHIPDTDTYEIEAPIPDINTN